MRQVVTEEEAKHKWCSFGLRFAHVKFVDCVTSSAINRSGKGHATEMETPCIGSKCMAWGWSKQEKDKGHCTRQ